MISVAEVTVVTRPEFREKSDGRVISFAAESRPAEPGLGTMSASSVQVRPMGRSPRPSVCPFVFLSVRLSIRRYIDFVPYIGQRLSFWVFEFLFFLGKWPKSLKSRNARHDNRSMLADADFFLTIGKYCLSVISS